MPSNASFETMLSGGHPNSLGRTIEVVELILADRDKLDNLYQCYFSADEVVRLRVSSAMKRVAREHPDWLVPYLDRFLTKISTIDQASTQWTLAQLFLELDDRLSEAQRLQAIEILKRNLAASNDWIVLNNTMEALATWAKDDEALEAWLTPHLERLATDSRKSVAAKAAKSLRALSRRK